MNRKYKFTGETIDHMGIELHRIESISNFGNVKKGDIGGFIAREGNLSVVDNAWVSDDAIVFGNAKVLGNATVSDDAWVFCDAMVYGNARIFGNTQICGDSRVTSDSWGFSPFYLQGSKDSITTSSYTTLAIDCHIRPVEYWQEHYEAFGRLNNYSKEEIIEYGWLIDVAASWLEFQHRVGRLPCQRMKNRA